MNKRNIKLAKKVQHQAIMRRYVSYLVIFALFLLPVFILVYQSRVDEKLNELKAKQQIELNRYFEILHRDFHLISQDLRTISSLPAVSQLLEQSIKKQTNSHSGKIRNSLSGTLLPFASEHKIYAQIRVIDRFGKEQLRIDTKDVKSVVIPANKLQNKSNRYYFKDAIKLNRGEYYVSPLDLNVENNKLEIPYRPTLRVAMPVFNNSSQVIGLVVLNYNAQQLFNNLLKIVEVDAIKPFVLNTNGHYLFGGDAEENFAFMFPYSENRQFAARYPQVWDQIKQNSSGFLDHKAGYFYFKRISPLNKINADTISQTKSKISKIKHLSDLLVITLIPRKDITKLHNKVARHLLPLPGLLLLIGAIILWRLAVLHQRRFNAQQELALNLEVQEILADLIELTLKVGSLEEKLSAALKRLCSCSFLPFNVKGIIFVINENNPKELRKIASHGVEAELEHECERIKTGSCRCGKALQIGEMRYEKESLCYKKASTTTLRPLGQYLTPLKDANRPLGVLNLYVDEEHVKRPEIKDFLISVSQVLVNIIIKTEIDEQLQVALHDAQAATRAKGEFLANMSHEIRTPLTAVIGLAEVCQNFSLNQEDQKRLLQNIKRNGSHLLDVINNVLDLSKLEAKQLELSEDSIYLPELIQDIESIVRLKADEKGLEYQSRLLTSVPQEFISDRVRIKQILINLIGNAIKFTDKGSVTLSINYLRSSQLLQFSVKDSGIGMSKEELEHIFTAFKQADASISQRFGGTGLGLTICKEFVECLSGTITVNSELNKGSEFLVSIPVSFIDEVKFISELPEPPSEDEESSHVPSLGGNVLVVDDGEANLELLEYLIKRCGAEVDTAKNGIEGLEKASANNFSLIIMDMQMPKLDGYAATKTLRRQGYKGKILALSAINQKQAIANCFSAGCDDYLPKPFSQKQFYSTLKRFLNSVNNNGAQDGSQRNGSNDSRFEKLIANYNLKLPGKVEALQSALNDSDLEKLKFLAHKLVGAALFGREDISTLARLLEGAAATEDKDASERILLQLHQLANESLKQKDKEPSSKPQQSHRS